MTNRLVSASRISISPKMTDSFTRANGAIGNLDTGQSWNGATWTIATNKAVNTPTLGSELVTNGSFSTDTSGWTAVNATITSEAGGTPGNCLQVANSGANNGYAYQVITTIVGQWYKVDFSYKNGTTTASVRIGTSAGASTYGTKGSSASWAGRSISFRATTTTTYITCITGSSTDGETALFDTISFKQMTNLSDLFCTVLTTVSNIEIKMKSTSTQQSEQGIVLNADSLTNPQNFVLFSFNRHFAIFYLTKCVNGVYTTVYSSGKTFTDLDLWSVKKIDTSYQLYYKNILQTTQTISDVEIKNNTIHGMFSDDGSAQSTISYFDAGTGTRTAVTNRFLIPKTTQKSMSFNGTSDYAISPINPSVNGFSLGFWIFRRILYTANTDIISCSSSGRTSGFAFFYDNTNGNNYNFFIKNASVQAYLTSTYKGIGQWMHHVTTWIPGSNNWKWYINGTFYKTGTSADMVTPGYPLTLGAAGNVANKASVNLKDLTFQNTTTPWTQAQISGLYYRNIIPDGATQYSLNNVATDQNGENALSLTGASYSTNVPFHMGVRSSV